MKDVKAEAKPEKEWVLYDDNYLRNIPGNWTEIVGNMSRLRAYPTVLIYERLEAIDEHNGESFNIK